MYAEREGADHQEQQRSVKTRFSIAWRRILQAGLLCAALATLPWIRARLDITAYGSRRNHDLEWTPIVHGYQQSTPRAQYERCSNVVASSVQSFEYNITAENTAAQQWRFLDSIPLDARRNLRGRVHVRRGNPLHASDIDVQVVIRSTHENDIKNVILSKSELQLGVEYESTDQEDMCTDMEVLVSFRPWPERTLNLFQLESNFLDLWVEGSLEWEINNLLTHTSHGDTYYSGARFQDPLITHNVSSTSLTGEIFGYYLADGNLKVQNEIGSTWVFLLPRYQGPLVTPESISVSSLSGKIHVEFTTMYWPMQPLNHTTDIHTTTGEIWAAVPHGSLTNVSNIRGNVKAFVVPFGAANQDDSSQLHTSSDQGRTFVSLYNAPLESLEGYYDPLLKLKSKHIVKEGALKLNYPYSWYGDLEARILHGPLKFDSSALQDIEKGDGFVKAKRGREGESVMEAYIDTGELAVLLGL